MPPRLVVMTLSKHQSHQAEGPVFTERLRASLQHYSIRKGQISPLLKRNYFSSNCSSTVLNSLEDELWQMLLQRFKPAPLLTNCTCPHTLCWDSSVTPEMLLCGKHQHQPWLLHSKSKLLPQFTKKGSFPFNTQTLKRIGEGTSASLILANLAIGTGTPGRKAVAKSQECGDI